MTYATPKAFRVALEHRLVAQSIESGISIDRLRRRVLFARILARLEAAEPGIWVLKGGMALEVRLQDDARLTKDVDLGLRDEVTNAADLHDRLIDALRVDPFADSFVLEVQRPTPLAEDEVGRSTWRASVTAHLAGTKFAGVHLDISPRSHELKDTDHVEVPNSLAFAGIPATIVEVVDIHRHAAEKFHGMLRDLGERENSRVRDLVDLVILLEHEMLDMSAVAAACVQVWSERNGTMPPATLPALPYSWPRSYERLAADLDLDARSFAVAYALMGDMWARMFPSKEI